MNALEFAQRGSTLKYDNRRKTKLPAEQRAKVVREFIAGKTSGVLARKYGVSANLICSWANRSGFKRRGWRS